MRVLLVNDYLEAGGCERVVQRTAEGLRARSHAVEMFTSADVPGRRTPWSYIDNRRARAALRRRLEAFEPDIVHLFNVYHELSPAVVEEAHRWRLGRKSRVVMTCADAHLVCPNSALQMFPGPGLQVEQLADARTNLWTTRWDDRSFAHSMMKSAQHAWNYQIRKRWRCLDAIICASRFLKRVLEPTGVPSVVIPDPLPIKVPTRSDSPVEESSRPVRLIFCGRVEPEKGLGPFLEYAAEVEGWLLEVVGEGRALADVRAIVEARGLDERVEFIGKVGADEAVSRIARAEVLILPSRCHENAPSSMMEALACGTGLLVSGLGGMPEIVAESGVGRVFDPFVGESVREKLAATIKESRSGEAHHYDASAYLGERSVEKYVTRLERLYDEVPGGMRCAC